MNNVFEMAMAAIPRVEFSVQKFVSRAPNDFGVLINVYTAPVSYWGCVQPVKNTKYEALGLQFGKNYITVWGEVEMNGIDRQAVADRILYNGKTFNVVSSSDWMAYNGWSSVIAVEEKLED